MASYPAYQAAVGADGWIADLKTYIDAGVGATSEMLPERLSLLSPGALAIEIMADSPKGYWKLDEPSGSATVADSSGNGHTGTVEANLKLGGLGLGNIPQGCAWLTRPTSNGTISVASHADFNVGDTFTLEICYRQRQDFQSSANVLIGLTSTDPCLRTDNPSVNQNPQLARYSSGAVKLASTGLVTETHLWHHIMVTKNGATAKMYLDGADVSDTYTAYTFAAGDNAVEITPGIYNKASICHAAVYNTALSSTRVAAHYAAFQRDNNYAQLPVAFGIHTDSMYFDPGEATSTVVTAAAAGAKLVRSTIRWEIVEATSGAAYDWTEHDAFVSDCVASGLTPLFIFSGTPTWLNGGSARGDVPGVGADADFKTFTSKCAKFAADFTDRYKPNGSGTATVADLWVELWNEPNLASFWNNLSANTDQQWADKYAYWYKHVRAAILSRHQTARITMAGLSSWSGAGGGNIGGEDFLRKVIGSAEWTNTHIDYGAYHPYSEGNNPDSVTISDNHYNDVIMVKDVLTELGYPYTPVCLTEFGFASTTSEADQASKLTVALGRITAEWSSFVPLLVWWPVSDSEYSTTYGLYGSVPGDGTVSTDTKAAAAVYIAAASPFVNRVRTPTIVKQQLDPATVTAAQIAEALVAAGLMDSA